MFKFKRVISLLLTVVFLTGVVPVRVFAGAEYLSREEAAILLAEEAVFYNKQATKERILTGELGQDEDEYVDRGDFIVMLTRAFGTLPEMTSFQKLKAPSKVNLKYNDVPDWAKPAVDELIAKGILTGNAERLLKPEDNITKAEMEVLIERIWSLYGTNPKDDLFAYVIKNNISKDNAGITYETIYNINETIFDILYDICINNKGQTLKEKKIRNYYSALVNFKERDEAGISPIQEYVDAIVNAKNHTELEKALIFIIKETGFNPLFDTSATVDPKNSNKYSYVFSVYPATFYVDELENDPDGLERVFTKYAETVFRAIGQNKEEAQKNAGELYKQEAELAKVSLNVNDMDDPSKWYNKTTFNQIAETITIIDMNKIFEAEKINTSKTVYISDMGLYNYYTKLYFDGTHLEDLKKMALLSIVSAYSGVLTTDLWTESIHLSNYLSGNASLNNYKPETLMALAAINRTQEVMQSYIEEIYCKKYYKKSTTAEVKAIVDEIIATYESDIANCSWMSKETKAKAIEKLKAIKCKIGHPDSFDTMIDDMEIFGADVSNAAFLNDFNISQYSFANYHLVVDSPVNKEGWAMCAYDVNAAYVPSSNCIYIPAGMLSAPMYDSKESKEKTMAKIGYVIAHEISHAFDDTGSQYDAKGNMSNWWTATDKEAFNKLCNSIEKYYEGYEAYNGITTKGNVTVGENYADICALNCVLSILDKQEKVNYKEFFETYALVLVSDDDRVYEEYVAVTDTHARGRARVNPAVSTLPQFYEAYGVTENDGMYIAPENRIKYW